MCVCVSVCMCVCGGVTTRVWGSVHVQEQVSVSVAHGAKRGSCMRFGNKIVCVCRCLLGLWG